MSINATRILIPVWTFYWLGFHYIAALDTNQPEDSYPQYQQDFYK